jgi:hypothetical protein
MEQKTIEKPGQIGMRQGLTHTTIALKRSTRKRLDNSRVQGQSLDGFINQLIEFWERYKIGNSLCSLGIPVYQKPKGFTEA